MLLGVGFARRLDDDAVEALAQDGRLAGAERVDPAADDLDGLGDGGWVDGAATAASSGRSEPRALSGLDSG